MPRSADSTRIRIITAATRLFYDEGIRAVSVDAVAEKAGVTKKTLYYHFRGKDELIAAYLQSRDQPTLDLYARWFAETQGSLADKVRGLFAKFGEAASHPRWRGCGFLRTVAELANAPGHPAVKAGAAHKKRFEQWLGGIFAEHGIDDRVELAREIMLLLDGAATVMLIHHDAAYVKAAGDLAGTLVEAASRRKADRPPGAVLRAVRSS
ncbi:TetR/AcrR family transcriptional regulator [Bradyrhizobium sp. ARR65]|uniref:TetR/AcrR family transcriptional regulator n=1 Tax=Bradyrhizobium sp. ARR65 TaxID=1040989 RepID=UPI000465BBC3|nr:TetR/AcrR family transcriptional regulator [Bradyrhizobium sp. ARR65]